jgi:hypothetical protein
MWMLFLSSFINFCLASNLKISQKQSESVGQTLPQMPWKQKRGDLKKIWIPFIKLPEKL